MTTPDTAKPSWWKRQNKIVKTIIIVFAVLFAIGIINGIATGGESDKPTAADTTTPAPTTEPTTEAPGVAPAVTEAPAPTTETPAPVTEEAPAPAIPGTSADPRCQPFDVTMIGGILTDTSLTPTNGQVIIDGEDKWIGATLMRPDGKMESRSDVWLMNDNGLFSVTSGARNSTWAAPASKVGYSAGDENAQAVDNCVIALTRQQ